MKKLKYLILLLLLVPITVFAKTPNKDETIKVIENIENVQVDEGIIIYSVSVDNKNIILNINDNGVVTEKKIEYIYKDNELVFKGGTYKIDNDIKEINNNDYAFYLYSIMENYSTVPYDIENYYNKTNIEKKIKEYKEDITYIDTSKTFGISLTKEVIGASDYIHINYHYYFDGDYPIILKEEETDEFKNPETGNYNIIITIMLMSVIGIGIYTCLDIPSKRIKGE